MYIIALVPCPSCWWRFQSLMTVYTNLLLKPCRFGCSAIIQCCFVVCYIDPFDISAFREFIKMVQAISYIFFIVSQQLVDGTRRLSTGGQDVEIYMELSALFSSKPDSFKCTRLDRCSKKDARKNLKVLASHSTSLLCTFTEYFLDSSPEKRAHLKVHLLLISFNFLIGYL